MLRVHRRRNRRSRRRHYGRSSRRRNPAGGMSFTMPVMSEVDDRPVSTVLPKMREVGGIIGTTFAGTLAFVGSNGIGVLVDNVLTQLNLGPTLGKAAGVVKFGTRFLVAHAAAATFFKSGRGLLSKTNGRFLLNLTIITGGLALLKDLGVIAMLPAQVQPLIPQLSAYDSGVTRGSLSRYHRRLRAYDSGIQRGSLSGSRVLGYDAGVRASQLSGNFDEMPVETASYNYGVPYGA